MTGDGHPIDVDLERILPILAREIYTSPFAFLRENVQNAFDAIQCRYFVKNRLQYLGNTESSSRSRVIVFQSRTLALA